MRLTKLTVYDVNAWLEKSGYQDANGNLYRVHGMPGEMALVEGMSDTGTLIINTEGVSEIVASTELFEIPVSPKFDNGAVSMYPIAMLRVSLHEMQKSCPKLKSVYIKDFIRKFGDRLESNFSITLRHMRKIGVDPECYHHGFNR